MQIGIPHPGAGEYYGQFIRDNSALSAINDIGCFINEGQSARYVTDALRAYRSARPQGLQEGCSFVFLFDMSLLGTHSICRKTADFSILLIHGRHYGAGSRKTAWL